MPSATTTRRAKRRERKIVHVRYPCYICGSTFSYATTVICHAESVHGILMPSRKVGTRRPKSFRYRFEKDPAKYRAAQRNGCPSCWYHCREDLEKVEQHITSEHDITEIEIEEFGSSGDEEEEEENGQNEGSNHDELDDEEVEQQDGDCQEDLVEEDVKQKRRRRVAIAHKEDRSYPSAKQILSKKVNKIDNTYKSKLRKS